MYRDPMILRNCSFVNNEADAAGGAVKSASDRDLLLKQHFRATRRTLEGPLGPVARQKYIGASLKRTNRVLDGDQL